MPSNKELIEKAEALAEELGVDIETEGLKNAELVDLVSDLREKAEALAEELGVDIETEGLKNAELVDLVSDLREKAEAPTGSDRDAAPEVDETNRYVVAQGKAITTRKGIKSDGDEVTPEILGGGPRDFELLLQRGYVVKT